MRVTRRKLLYISFLGIFFFLTTRGASAQVLDSMLDTDLDGLNNGDESIYYTDPVNPDTDGDGFWDGQEVYSGYSPHTVEHTRLDVSDYDKDRLTDAQERVWGTDMGREDSDGDSHSDYNEVMYGFDPLDQHPVKKYDQKILVNRSTQRLQFLVADRVMLDVPVSTGIIGRQTPVGTFAVQKKVPVKRYTGATYDYKNVKWNLQFIPMYYLHTAYWHNDFGIKPKSSGCVNMREKDVEILYTYVQVGTPVQVIGTTPTKPLTVAVTL